MIAISYAVLLASSSLLVQAQNSMVIGDDFSIPDTQQVEFVPLAPIDRVELSDPTLPRSLDLRGSQSKVKSQGNRGACTYFVFTGLVESLLKSQSGQEIDLSEEYLAWAGKVRLGRRQLDEGSSVAVNALAFQRFGFMLEKQMPYQRSWFEQGMPCEGQKADSSVNPRCFSHDGPQSDAPIFSGNHFVFKAVDSRSIDLVRELAVSRRPVTVSMIGHREMWAQSAKSGEFFLSEAHKKECQANRTLCSGHAVLATGYDLDRKVVFIKNSWGEGWGDHGYGTMPFDYLDQMSHRKFVTGRIVRAVP